MNFLFKRIPDHIYIHLPFCVKRCSYCDFVALAQHGDFMRQYNHALIREIEIFANKNKDVVSAAIKTIFIGGGTPSLYPNDYLEMIFQSLHRYFDLTGLEEVTIEVNPTDVTESKLLVWKNLGINRLSMGVQVLDDVVLRKLNRPQRVEDVFAAIQLIPSYFENISVDLILGLPGVSDDVWMSTLSTVVEWAIKHISVYWLTVYEKTPLYFKLKSGELSLESEDKTAELYEATVSLLNSRNFNRYEISNFAKNGYESRHNMAYWQRFPYCGFGLGAASFDGINRYSSQKNLEKYIQSILSCGELPIEFFESLSPKQEVLELLMLGLRMEIGLDLQRVLYLLSDIQKETMLRNIMCLKNGMFITESQTGIRLTAKGMLFENKVVLDLIEAVF